MTDFQFSKAYPSQYLRSPDLNGKECTLTVKSWRYIDTKKDLGDDGRPMKGIVLAFKETPKEYVSGVTVFRQIQQVLGFDPNTWIEKKITFYPTTCRFGKDPKHPCIRVKTS
jgi:hypothetical protein